MLVTSLTFLCLEMYMYNEVFHDLISPTFPAEMSVRLRSSVEALRMFFSSQPDLQVHLCCGEQSLGRAEIPLSDLTKKISTEIYMKPVSVEGSFELIPPKRAKQQLSAVPTGLSPTVGLSVVLRKEDLAMKTPVKEGYPSPIRSPAARSPAKVEQTLPGKTQKQRPRLPTHEWQHASPKPNDERKEEYKDDFEQATHENVSSLEEEQKEGTFSSVYSRNSNLSNGTAFDGSGQKKCYQRKPLLSPGSFKYHSTPEQHRSSPVPLHGLFNTSRSHTPINFSSRTPASYSFSSSTPEPSPTSRETFRLTTSFSGPNSSANDYLFKPVKPETQRSRTPNGTNFGSFTEMPSNLFRNGFSFTEKHSASFGNGFQSPCYPSAFRPVNFNTDSCKFLPIRSTTPVFQTAFGERPTDIPARNTQTFREKDILEFSDSEMIDE